VLLDELLYQPDAAIVRQATDPRLMEMLNLGGFGVAAWDQGSSNPGRPFTYRTSGVPVFDRNLKALAEKVVATGVVAHVRGVVYKPTERVGPQNVHPFRFADAPFVMAQNGDLFRFDEMRRDLLEHIPQALASRIEGTTDTEWLYALCLSQLADLSAPCGTDEMVAAIEATLRIVREHRERRGIDKQSPVNLVLSDGRSMVATRYVFDYGWYPDDGSFFAGEREHDFTTLWYTAGGGYEVVDGEWRMNGGGHTSSVLVASEPLTLDASTWLQVPEYAMLVATPDDDGGLALDLRELVL
jgi:predicted glutamine amidotransferase